MDMGFTDSRAFVTNDFVANDGTAGLRPLGWGELCARLTAAQDLRRQQMTAGEHAAGTPAVALGSFHALAAHMLEQHGEMKDLVNPTSSINGKGNAGKSGNSHPSPMIECEPHVADENRHD